MTLSEVFLNYLEHLAVQKSHFAGSDRDAWIKFAGLALANSPVTKRRLRKNGANYSPALLELLDDEPAGPAPTG